MIFLIRADASFNIGSGHIMRCLTLANALKKEAHQVHFVCRDLPGNLISIIQEAGFNCTILITNDTDPLQKDIENLKVAHADWLPISQQQDITDCKTIICQIKPDWIIVDHYALSKPWQQQARTYTDCKIMVIDDLADRQHDADLLLDQNIGRKAADYYELIPQHCKTLFGPHYALLRPEFRQWRRVSLNHRLSHKNLKKILVNLGGVDKDNYTLTILKNLAQASMGSSSSLEVTVVMGATAPHIHTIQDYAKHAPFPCRILVNIQNIAEVMSQVDLAIGAAGSTSWERCCLGLATLQIILAENQRYTANLLHQMQAAILINSNQELSNYIKLFLSSNENFQDELKQITINSSRITDGTGVKKVIQLIQNSLLLT